MEHESGDDTISNWRTRYSHQRIDKGTGGFGNKRTSGDHSDDSNFRIGQNNKNSFADLKRLAVTQSLVKNHLQTLV